MHAVEESVCQWCGARIYLVRVCINNWEWVTDLKRPLRKLEMLCRRGMASCAFAPAGLVRLLEIDIPERLAVVVAHYKAGVSRQTRAAGSGEATQRPQSSSASRFIAGACGLE